MFSGSRGAEALTIKEAAVLANVTEKVIRHELASRVVWPRRKGSRHVELDSRAVLYLSLVSNLRVELSKGDRKDLFELITHRRSRKGHWKREGSRLILEGRVPVVLSLSGLDRVVDERLKLFARGKRRIVSKRDVLGGEPVFEGTRVSVRHVGELAKKGVPLSALREDFPNLSEPDIEFARIFAALGRPPGRPRKLKFVRA
jgi:uncharacterized protein (DUF433 family)